LLERRNREADLANSTEVSTITSQHSQIGRGPREMDKDYLLLKRAALSRPSGKWNDDDYDVLADGAVAFGESPRSGARPGAMPTTTAAS
jgi:hypothetical protein